MRQGGGFGEVERERGFPHRRTSREDDHFLALETPHERIEILETRRHSRQFALFHHHFRDDVHRLARGLAHLLGTFTHAILRHRENSRFDLVHEFVDAARKPVAILHRTGGRTDNFAQQALFADFFDKIPRLRGGRNPTAHLRKEGVATDGIELSRSLQLLGHHRNFNRFLAIVEIDQNLVDHPVLRVVK